MWLIVCTVLYCTYVSGYTSQKSACKNLRLSGWASVARHGPDLSRSVPICVEGSCKASCACIGSARQRGSPAGMPHSWLRVDDVWMIPACAPCVDAPYRAFAPILEPTGFRLWNDRDSPRGAWRRPGTPLPGAVLQCACSRRPWSHRPQPRGSWAQLRSYKYGCRCRSTVAGSGNTHTILTRPSRVRTPRISRTSLSPPFPSSLLYPLPSLLQLPLLSSPFLPSHYGPFRT